MICSLVRSADLKRQQHAIARSPLIAAYAPKPFTKIILCEKNSVTATACESRCCSWSRRPLRDREGDCNQQIDEICGHIPPKSLTLAFC